MPVAFEWDLEKAESNRRKHGVDFAEATAVFGDTLSTTIPDPDHSLPGEDRELTIGMSHRHRLIVVAHCRRGKNVRIINARPATRHERRAYEES
jgi:uncharacterized DUF497 family protein